MWFVECVFRHRTPTTLLRLMVVCFMLSAQIIVSQPVPVFLRVLV